MILLTILGLVSAANAALTWKDAGSTDIDSVDIMEGGTATVYLYSDTANLSMVNWVDPGNIAVARVTGGSALSAAGKGATYGIDPSGYTGWARGESLPGDDATSITVGLWYELVISAFGTDGESTVMSSDYYAATSGGGVTDLLTVNIIPEPMTISILGLGGLLLRRRKK